MKTPLVSVLMITYQHAPFIAQAIEGVMRQRTDFCFEVVIGVDPGADDTLSIVQRFQQAHPDTLRVITSAQNVGAAENFRRTALACCGEFVAICEGDDYWVSESKLQQQVDVLLARPSVSSVFTDFGVARWKHGCWIVDEKSALAEVSLASLRGSLKGLPQSGMLRTLTGMHRAEVLRSLFRRSLPLSEYPFADSFLVAEAMQQGEIEILPFVTAVYRVSPNSTTRGSAVANLKLLEKLRDFQIRFESFFPQLGPPDPRRLHETEIGICRAAFSANDLEAFERGMRRLRDLGFPVPPYLLGLRLLLQRPVLRRFSLGIRAMLESLAR